MSGTAGETPPTGEQGDADHGSPMIRRRANRAPLYVAVAVVVVVVLVVVAGYQASWFKAKTQKPGACPTGVTLLGAGANFISPLMSSWTGPSGAFDAQTSNHVNYNAGGAGFGITAITTKTVDFAATDDPLGAAQISGLPDSVMTLPVTAGALAIVYNLPHVSGPVQLSGPILAEIYLGTITHWNDLQITAINPTLSLPNNVITTVHREDPAGTTFVLTDLLSKDSSAWASGPGKGIQISWPSAPTQLAFTKNSVLLSYVKANAYTIGYVDLSDVLNAQWSQYASLRNPAGNYVLPTLASTTSAIVDLSSTTTFPPASATTQWQNVSMVNAPGSADYPLATFAYFFVYQALDAGYTSTLPKAQVVVEWLAWAITTGQGFSAGDNYVALPHSLVQLDQNAIGQLTFAGKGIPACSSP